LDYKQKRDGIVCVKVVSGQIFGRPWARMEVNMIWQHLREEEFAPAIKESGSVCVMPVGSLEMHGQHLPVGTDILKASFILQKAAEIEPVCVFPDFAFGDVQAHTAHLGAIRLPVELVQQLLTELCREIARNGFKKIILFNSHGGNRAILENFVNSTFHKKKDYVVMTYYNKIAGPADLLQLLSEKGRSYFPELTEADLAVLQDYVDLAKTGGHACFGETATMLGSFPELVRMDRIHAVNGLSTGRADFLSQLEVAGNFWSVNHPENYSGHAPDGCNERIGRCTVRVMTDNLVQVLRTVKNSDEMLVWNDERNKAWL
jgi:creatinine amidohydrolase